LQLLYVIDVDTESVKSELVENWVFWTLQILLGFIFFCCYFVIWNLIYNTS